MNMHLTRLWALHSFHASKYRTDVGFIRDTLLNRNLFLGCVPNRGKLELQWTIDDLDRCRGLEDSLLIFMMALLVIAAPEAITSCASVCHAVTILRVTDGVENCKKNLTIAQGLG